jgi:hypothetical protein
MSSKLRDEIKTTLSSELTCERPRDDNDLRESKTEWYSFVKGGRHEGKGRSGESSQ